MRCCVACEIYPRKNFKEKFADLSWTDKTLWRVHFGAVVVELVNCKCGGIVRNDMVRVKCQFVKLWDLSIDCL